MTQEQTPALKAFIREERYIVVKRKGLTDGQEVELRHILRCHHVPTVECVVVEEDWPEYETVWQMIEDRCVGKVKAPDPAVTGLVEALESIQLIASNHAGWIEQKMEIRWAVVCDLHKLASQALEAWSAQ